MSDESHETIEETIEDIVDDIRAQNQGLPEGSYALSPLVCDLLSIADRIEAALKREKAKPVRNCDKYKTAEGALAGFNEMCKEVDLYKKTFKKICECLNKDIEVSKTIHKVDGSSTSFISDHGALPIIFEIAKIIKDTVKEGEE